ncbi:Esterase [Trametes pubescens]|uniref:Esterase n=1 Tax=Trametes pubescens TaxID=154538 RepID=A0A1M2V747_TRAPU|nr:Esterase [Trametes pubescens]
MARDSPILNRQPFKGLYLAYFSLSFLVKIPAWTIWYIPRSNRSRRSWSIKRSLIVRTAQEMFSCKVDLTAENKPPSEEPVPDSKLKDAKFTWVEGISDDLFVGEVRRIAELTGVKPARVAGFWLLKANTPWKGLKAQPGEKTVLHLHGGAFHVRPAPAASPPLRLHTRAQISSANPSDITANFTRGLLQHSTELQRTFAVEYRLCNAAPFTPANPFPAALLDTLAAYRFLVQDAGFEPRNVIVVGDSAGGSLVLALARHLIENPIPALPPPGALLTASAWLDLCMSRRGPGTSETLNGPIDIFGVSDEDPFAEYGVRGYQGPLDFEEIRTNRYISPMSLYVKPGPDGSVFKGFPQTYIVAGGAERLLDDSVAMVEKMTEEGVKVVSDISPDAIHDFVVFTWHEPEHTDTLRRIAKWIDEM